MSRINLRPAWALTGALAALDFFLLPFAGFTVSSKAFIGILGVGCIVLLLAEFYRRMRPDQIIAAALDGTGLLIIYSLIAALFSYIATAAALPLQDLHLARIDQILGFDFVAHIAWVAERPWLRRLLEIVYFICALELILIIYVLSFYDRNALARFLIAYCYSAFAVITLAALIPAIGAYLHHPIGSDLLSHYEAINAGRWHLLHFEELRAGTFGAFEPGSVEGLVTFPSFHAVLAVLMGRALWVVPVLRWPGVVLNLAIFLSALSIGGHYLIDLLIGGLIGLCSLYWVEKVPVRAGTKALDPLPRQG